MRLGTIVVRSRNEFRFPCSQPEPPTPSRNLSTLRVPHVRFSNLGLGCTNLLRINFVAKCRVVSSLVCKTVGRWLSAEFEKWRDASSTGTAPSVSP